MRFLPTPLDGRSADVPIRRLLVQMCGAKHRWFGKGPADQLQANPSSEKPHGIEIAGRPRTSNGVV